MDSEDFGRNNPSFQRYIPPCYGKYQRYIPSVYFKQRDTLSDKDAEAADSTEVEKRRTSKSIQDKQVAMV